MSREDIMDLCRLCLKNEHVEIFIFQESEEEPILSKINTCLPVKVSRTDKLPKKICVECLSKLDSFHKFWEETLETEEQLNLLLRNEYDNNETKNLVFPNLNIQTSEDNNNNDNIEDAKHEPVHANAESNVPHISVNQFSTPFDSIPSFQPTILQNSSSNVFDENTRDTPLRDDEAVSDDSQTSSIFLVPIVQLSEGNCLHNEDINHPSAATLKSLGYKNPFVYPQLKNKRRTFKKLESWNSNKWQCMICSDVKMNKTELMEHYQSHKEETEPLKGNKLMGDYFICPVCLIDFTSLISYEKHVELNHGEKQYNCETCHKSFKNLYSLSVHNHKRHNTEKIFKCSGCDFKDDELKSLRSHIRAVHEEHVKYRCEICNKGFSTLSWYQEHKNFHTGAMPFECEICTKSFPYTRYLIAHKKNMHPEMFPTVPINHECEICHKKFAHKKSLILHLRGHTGESAVLCDMCGKSLSSAEHLKQHLRIHTGYKPHCCSVCGKGFAKKCNLTLHERVHSGEKPHVCNVCGKGFSQRSTLVIHGRYHSGERPYQCQICHKGFVAKGLLGVHMKTCLDVSD